VTSELSNRGKERLAFYKCIAGFRASEKKTKPAGCLGVRQPVETDMLLMKTNSKVLPLIAQNLRA